MKWKKFAKQLLVVLVLPIAATALFAGVGVPWFLGVVSVVGIGRAWSLAQPWLVQCFLAMAFLVGAMYAIGRVYVVGRWALRRWLAEKWRQLLAKVVSATLLLGFGVLVISALVMERWDAGRQMGQGSPFGHVGDARHLAASVEEQRNNLSRLAGNAKQVLAALDRTDLSLAASRRDILAAMRAADTQLAATDSAAKSIAALVERERRIEAQASELERILGGQAPLTRADLERSQRSGFVQGVIASLLAALILGGWRRIAAWSWLKIGPLLRR